METAVVLRCRDRWDREIILTGRTWYDHVLRNHAELIDHLAAVERTIRRPQRVNLDKDYDDREIFYRRGVLPVPYDRDYLKVVVEFGNDPRYGRVVTAFLTETIKAGEPMRWS